MKFFPKVTKQFKPQEDGYVFMQIYLPQGKAEIQPEFSVLGENNISESIQGELIAESWNRGLKVWAGIFKLNLSTMSPGDNTLKIEIPVS